MPNETGQPVPHLPGQDDGEFSVWQFFADGDQEQVLRFVSAERAVSQAKSLADSLGGQLGTTQRIIITDGEDFTCFEWQHGSGVLFPPPPEPGG